MFGHFVPAAKAAEPVTKFKRGPRGVLWIAAGTAALFAFLLTMLRFHDDRNNAADGAKPAQVELALTQFQACDRELLNTNIQALSIPLPQKREAVLRCQAALDALEEAILAEPIAGTALRMRVKPR
jgi:hypothetical protein